VTGQGDGGLADADQPRFDPRHDPRFQRGYQPGDTRPPQRQARSATPAAEETARPLPAALRAEAPAVDSSDEPDALGADLFTADAFQDEYERPRRNPFITALWIVGILFVTGAVALQWQAMTYSFSNYSYSGNGPMPFGMMLQQVAYAIASPMLMVGLIVMAGLLFWHAAGWRASHRPPHSL
jgi:hypothetical protein